jgi:hypothetical protein
MLVAASAIALMVLVVSIAPRDLIENALNRGTISEESAIGRTLVKWQRTIETASTDPTIATAGRDIEVREALAHMRTPTDWLFGVGYGWYFYFPEDPAPYHFVHVSYLNYLITYGVVGAVPLCILIGIGFLVIWRASLRRGAPPLLGTISLFLCSYLVLAFTANMLSVYIVLWVLMGVGVRLASVSNSWRW